MKLLSIDKVLVAVLFGGLFLYGCSGDGGWEGQEDGGSAIQADGQVLSPDSQQQVPTCGNNELEGSEVCDGTNLGGKTCEILGFAGGTLKCAADCNDFDPSGCQGGDGRQFGDKCGGSWGECATGLMCVQFNEAGNDEGYCTQECSDSSPCPSSPAGAECVFKLVSSGKTICGFLCDASNPTCPQGLNCTYSKEGQYYYCSTDAAAKCGNSVLEFSEECDGTDLNNMSCNAFGYTAGTLTCDSSCKFDKTACKGQSTCGNVPTWKCTAGNAACSKLELFQPFNGNGYVVTHGQSFSYIRHDTMMLVKYAAASVACMMPGSFPIGLGDMSMSNGGTPKDASGLRHPQNTHDYGRDIDVAYYQVGQPNNNLRPVCPHTINGKEQYHCTGKPNIMDADRTALFFAKLFEGDRVRVAGVDGQIGPEIIAAAKKLHGKGMITTAALNAISSGKMAYETTNTQKGWYYFHHHHLHLSTLTASYSTPVEPPPVQPPAEGWEQTLDQMPPMVWPAKVNAKNLVAEPFELTQKHLDLLSRAARPKLLGSYSQLK